MKCLLRFGEIGSNVQSIVQTVARNLDVNVKELRKKRFSALYVSRISSEEHLKPVPLKLGAASMHSG